MLARYDECCRHNEGYYADRKCKPAMIVELKRAKVSAGALLSASACLAMRMLSDEGAAHLVNGWVAGHEL